MELFILILFAVAFWTFCIWAPLALNRKVKRAIYEAKVRDARILADEINRGRKEGQ